MNYISRRSGLMQNIQTVGFSEKTDSMVAGKASFPADISCSKLTIKTFK